MLVGDTSYFSFERLEISSDQSVVLNAHGDASEVLVRVSGGVTTQIQGVLATDRGVRLVMINPAGIELSGSGQINGTTGLVLTTAAELEMSDGDVFPTSATEVDDPSGHPVGFRFTDPVAAVSLNGIEQDLSASDLALFGGGVNIRDCELEVASGRLFLAGAAADDQISFVGGVVELTGDGSGIVISEDSAISITSGDATITGDSVRVSDSTLSQSGPSPSGILQLAGNVIGITGASITTSGEFSHRIDVSGAEITVSAAEIRSEGSSALGGIRITASTEFNMLESELHVASTAAAVDAGGIRIEAPQQLFVTTLATSLDASGPGGSISLSGDNLLLRDGPDFDARSGASIAPSVTLDFEVGIRVEDSDPAFDFTGAGISTSLLSHGNAGRGGPVRVETPSLVVFAEPFAMVSTGALGPGSVTMEHDIITLIGGNVSSDTFSDTADGADLVVHTEEIDGTGGSFAALAEEGTAGSVRIEVEESAVFDRTHVYSSAQEGNASDVRIEGLDLSFKRALIRSSSLEGTAGHIQLQAADSLYLDRAQVTNSSPVGGEGGIEMLVGNVIGLTATTVSTQVGTTVAEGAGEILVSAHTIDVAGTTFDSGATVGVGARVELEGHELTVDNGSTISSCSDDGAGDLLLDFTKTIQFSAGGGREPSLMAACSSAGPGGELAMESPLIHQDPPPTIDVSSSGDSDDGTVGGVSTSTLVAVDATPSDDCDGTFLRIQAGVDRSADLTLQLEEVSHSAERCIAIDGESADVLTQSKQEPVGEGCPGGGISVDIGTDDGGGDEGIAGNGRIEASEIDDTVLFCVVVSVADPDPADAVESPDVVESADNGADSDGAEQAADGTDEPPDEDFGPDEAAADPGEQDTREGEDRNTSSDDGVSLSGDSTTEDSSSNDDSALSADEDDAEEDDQSGSSSASREEDDPGCAAAAGTRGPLNLALFLLALLLSRIGGLKQKEAAEIFAEAAVQPPALAD